MRIIITAVLLCMVLNGFAQTVITGQVKNAAPVATITVNVPFSNWLYDDNNTVAAINNGGTFTVNVTVTQPQFIVLTCNSTRIKMYAEPSKNIKLSFDAKDIEHTISFSGNLAAENNICAKTGVSFFSLYPQLYNDSTTSPLDMYEKMKEAQTSVLNIVTVAGRISNTFRQIITNEIAYYPAVKLFDLSFADEAWSVEPSRPPHYALADWKQAIAMAYDDNRVSNNSAVNSYNYLAALNNFPFFIQRRFDKKEDVASLAEKIMAMPFADVLTTMRSKASAILILKRLPFTCVTQPCKKHWLVLLTGRYTRVSWAALMKRTIILKIAFPIANTPLMLAAQWRNTLRRRQVQKTGTHLLQIPLLTLNMLWRL